MPANKDEDVLKLLDMLKNQGPLEAAASLAGTEVGNPLDSDEDPEAYEMPFRRGVNARPKRRSSTDLS